MLRLTSNISIRSESGRNFSFDFLNEVDIESGWDQMTSTAEVTLPSNIRTSDSDSFLSPDAAQSLFKVGDRIDISLGYDDNLINHFSGFIVTVAPGLPVRLICEDGQFNLKRKSIKIPDPALTFNNSNNVGLNELLNQVFFASGLGIKINVNPGVTGLENIKLGKFRVKGEISVSEILEKIKDYGFAVFFRGREDLYVLPPSLVNVEPLTGFPATFDFSRNVIRDDRLELVSTEQKKKTIVAVSNDSETNEKTQFPESTDNDDNVTKINFPENLSKSDLEFFAGAKLDQEVFKGFEGHFLAFGEPFTRHGEKIILIDPKVPERNGQYIVRKTRVRFGTRGFRRKIYPWKEATL